jgi:hypothetical protein
VYHCCRRFRLCWRCRVATTGSLYAVSRAVSSAYVAIVVFLASLQYKLDILEAPSHFLVVRLISLYSNLNINCYVLFENFCQRCMILIVDKVDWGRYFLFFIVVPIFCRSVNIVKRFIPNSSVYVQCIESNEHA